MTETEKVLRDKISELEQWKKVAIREMADYQEIGAELGLKVGESITDKILPALRERRILCETYRYFLEKTFDLLFIS